MASALSKDEKGEGDILFLYRQHHLRQKPFLRRNLRKALHQLHATTKRALMGSFLSRPKQSRAREPSDNDDEDLSRPSKRRKTSQHNDHEGDVHLPTHPPLGNGEPGASVLGGAGDDHRFEIPLRTAPTFGQAAPKVKQDLFELESILPKVPEYTLRIDVLGISHDNENAVDLSRVKNGQNIKCGVMLAIFTTENENSSEYFEVHRAAQVGSMMTTIENGKPGATISIPKPFFVKAEELYVNKGDENWLSDSYKLLFWVKPVGPQPNWPPLDTATSVKSSNLAGILEKENATLKQLWMFCSTSFLLDPQRQTDPLNISLIYGVQTKASSKAATSYMLDLDINWSLPGSLSTFASRPSEVQPAAGSKSDNLLEPANGSPRRVQRRRNEATNYNLKVLSDRARGDLPKVPKLKETRSAPGAGAAEQGNNVSVIYTVGRADAEDFGIKQKTTVSGFTCVICCKDHRSLEKLRQHFKSEHRQFIFHLRGSQQPRIKFCVSLSDRISSLEPSRIIQLGRPKTLFDLGRFLEGDMSWEKARRGPQHNLWPEHLADQFQASPSSSPAVSRHSSPNTSLGASEENLDSLEPKASVQFTRPKKLRVPKTAQTLYHPVTKRPLIPGEEIDNSDDESDEGWLNQKHRDIIMNYTDVTDSEKDYIIRWNPFITSLKLSSDIYMPQIIKRFVSENKLWFLTDNNRIKEFCKHTEALMLRGTIDFDCFAQCMEMLKEADKNTSEHNIRKAQISEIPTWDKTRHRGFMDCICCLPVDSIGPLNRVVCNGPNCISPYFHPRCVQEAIIDAQGFLKNLHELKTWKCGACRDDQRVIIRVAGSFFN